MIYQTIMNRMTLAVSMAATMIMTSCSKDDYKAAIPRNAIALMMVDMTKTGGDNAVAKDMADSGIDFTNDVILFETSDRNFGLCASIEDHAMLEEWIGRKVKEKECTDVTRRNDVTFVFYKDAWVVGFDERSLLMLGPVLPNMKQQLQQQMTRWLGQDRSQSIMESRLYAVVDSIAAPMKMIANISALPETFVAPFTVGLPPNTDPSQVYVKAEISRTSDILSMKGESFSFNKRVDEALKKAAMVFRPLNGRFHELPQDAFLTLLTNVEGTSFIETMQRDKALKGVLAGLQAVIDLNSVFRSVDGEFMLSVTPEHLSTDMATDGTQHSFTMQAELANDDFAKKVWHNASAGFSFSISQAVDGKKDVLLCSNANGDPTDHPSRDCSPFIKGERMCLVVQLNALDNEMSLAVKSILATVFGNASTLLYTIK